MKASRIIEECLRNGIDFFTGVPDSQLKGLCDELYARFGTGGKQHIVAHNEGGAIALCAGHYLATGKPVVSTPVPIQVRDYADCIYIASGKEDFIEKCRQALAEPEGSPLRRMRMEQGKACSWDERVKAMRDILGSAGGR